MPRQSKGVYWVPAEGGVDRSNGGRWKITYRRKQKTFNYPNTEAGKKAANREAKQWKQRLDRDRNRPRSNTPTVAEAVQAYRDLHISTLSPRPAKNLGQSFDLLLSSIDQPEKNHLEWIKPDEWTSIRNQIVRRYAPSTAIRHIRSITSFLRWAQDHFDYTIRHPKLTPPPKSQVRKSKIVRQQVTPDEFLNAVLRADDKQTIAAMWLGINCGAGATDMVELKPEHIIGDELRHYRSKTGILRRALLLDQTLAALLALGGEMFTARPGSITKRCLDNGVGLRRLRHTMRTICAGLPTHIVDPYMAHEAAHTASVYVDREHLTREQLEPPRAAIREWLKN